MGNAQVLIVGAGPTGLVLALWLARQGVPLRIIEAHGGPGESSRAMVVQARTLEFYRQLGFADEAVKRGIQVDAVHLREGTREIVTFPFGNFGRGVSPYPFMLSLPQDDHERLLIEQLDALGVAVQWNTELLGFLDDGTRITATLRTPLGDETFDTAYLCGCDGAHSTVRQVLNIEFPGGTYHHVFYVADVRASGEAANGTFNACLGETGFCLVFPVRSSGTQRLIGIVPDEFEHSEVVNFDDVQLAAEALTGIRVHQVNWFSTYRVHHRVAKHFRHGRAFVCGDAGHIHSPAGGQGMNTGIGDAVNLAWKLATVLKGRADPELLDSYEIERIAFARSLVASTDKAFQAIVSPDLGGKVFRTVLLPYLIPAALGLDAVRRMAFRTLSQTRINYRHSPISSSGVGEIHGGDRLPWLGAIGVDNFEPLRSLEWQLHVYGKLDVALRDTAGALGVAPIALEWDNRMSAAGFQRDAFYLVRPDGHVALAGAEQDVTLLRQFFAA